MIPQQDAMFPPSNAQTKVNRVIRAILDYHKHQFHYTDGTKNAEYALEAIERIVGNGI